MTKLIAAFVIILVIVAGWKLVGCYKQVEAESRMQKKAETGADIRPEQLEGMPYELTPSLQAAQKNGADGLRARRSRSAPSTARDGRGWWSGSAASCRSKRLPSSWSGTRSSCRERPANRRARRKPSPTRCGRRSACRVLLWDERLSTRQAERALREGNVRRERRRRSIDSMAAAVILQSFLDAGPRGD